MPKDYTVTEQTRETNVNASTQRVERGWRVYYRDEQTGAISDVFVGESVYTPEGVDTLIREQLGRLRGVHSLGG